MIDASMAHSMTRPAPVAVMIYRRPAHLRNTLTALLACHNSDQHEIHVFGDGPRTEADIEPVAQARSVAREMLGKAAHYHFSDQNRGLSASVIAAVDQLTASHGDVIVLEDDLVLAPNTLGFFQQALGRYRDDDLVMQVSAHMFASPALAKRQETLFLPFTTSWGWATWRRAWSHFDASASGWQQLRQDRALRRRFNLNGSYDFAAMLEAQMEGQRDSWAIRWYWSVFQAEGLVAYPPRSLVHNTGFDGSGTHGSALLRRFGFDGRTQQAQPITLSEHISIEPDLFREVSRAIYRQNGGLVGKVVDRVRKLVR